MSTQDPKETPFPLFGMGINQYFCRLKDLIRTYQEWTIWLFSLQIKTAYSKLQGTTYNSPINDCHVGLNFLLLPLRGHHCLLRSAWIIKWAYPVPVRHPWTQNHVFVCWTVQPACTEHRSDRRIGWSLKAILPPHRWAYL